MPSTPVTCSAPGKLPRPLLQPLRHRWSPIQAYVNVVLAALRGKPTPKSRTCGRRIPKNGASANPIGPPPGGESLRAMRERVTRATTLLAQQHFGGQIVLVAHGGVLDQLYRLATGQELQAPRSWHLGNAAINRLLWTPDGLTLVGWGDTGHLEAVALDEESV